MNRVKVRLKELGICPCGFSVVCDHIELGTEYTIHPETIVSGYKFVCGGCGQILHNVTCVLVDDRHSPLFAPAPLPLALFDLGEMN